MNETLSSSAPCTEGRSTQSQGRLVRWPSHGHRNLVMFEIRSRSFLGNKGMV